MKIDSALMSGGYQTTIEEKQTAVETDAFKTALEKAASEKNLDKLKEASQEFEAYFVNTLLKVMRNTIQEGGLVKKSQARETFEGMLDEEMAKKIAKGGGIGLADMIYQNMLKAYDK